MNTPAHLLNATCSISTPGLTIDVTGMDAESTSGVVAGVACRLDIDSSSQGLEHQRVTGSARGRVFLPPSASAPKGSKILIGSETWRVIGQSFHPGGLSGVLLTVYVEREN